MNYVPETLYSLQKKLIKRKETLSEHNGNVTELVKLYSYQMFRALAYLDGVGICHRDIKPSNVLCNPATHQVLFCDFGSAKKLQKSTFLTTAEANVAYICSRYYRAPELIIGATFYTNAIDVWSTGTSSSLIQTGTYRQPYFYFQCSKHLKW